MSQFANSLFPSPPSASSPGGSIHGVPLGLVRAENLAILVVAVIAYRATGGGWLLFAILFFLPDLSILAYLAGNGLGARIYNLVHTYATPALFAAGVWWIGQPALQHFTLIWCAHIGFDRVLGFGLKYPSAFGDTHLGRIGARP